MKVYIRQYQKYFGFILGTFFCSSFSIALIPWIDQLPESGQKVISIIIAAVFWLGLIAGLIITFIMNKQMKMVRGKIYVKEHMEHPKFPGIIRFSAKPVNMAIYGVIAAGVLIAILDIIKTFVPFKLMFIILFLTYDAVVLHSIIDGKNYKVYQVLKEGISNEHKQKKKTE